MLDDEEDRPSAIRTSARTLPQSLGLVVHIWASLRDEDAAHEADMPAALDAELPEAAKLLPAPRLA